MADMNYSDRYPVIKGSWLVGNNLVYHRREYDTRYLVDGVQQAAWSDAVNEWEIRTCCGLLLDSWTRDTDRNMRYTLDSLRRRKMGRFW